MVQFETPKALANFSPGLERIATTLGKLSPDQLNPERVHLLANPFRVSAFVNNVTQGSRAARTLGKLSPDQLNPERVHLLANPFRVSTYVNNVTQGSRAARTLMG